MASLLFLSIIARQIEAVGGELSLTWNDSSTGDVRFSVERSTDPTETSTFGEIATTEPGVTTYTDPSVADATTYCYRVRAFNTAAFSDYSNLACATTPRTFSLAVLKIGFGSGTIVSVPAGVICGPRCSGTYPSGTTVTLTVSTAPGSVFRGWRGGRCHSTGPCTIALTSRKTVKAIFARHP